MPSVRMVEQSEIVQRTAGFCGADVKALCAEATLLAVRR